MKVNKRLILGLIVGVAVFAAAFGMAASLGGLNTDTLGADDSVVAACDTVGGIDVTYETSYDSVATAGYKVDSVSLESVDAACDGLAFKVTLAGDTVDEEATGTLSLTTGGESVTFAGTTLAEDVEDVHVVISGTPAP